MSKRVKAAYAKKFAEKLASKKRPLDQDGGAESAMIKELLPRFYKFAALRAADDCGKDCTCNFHEISKTELVKLADSVIAAAIENEGWTGRPTPLTLYRRTE